MKRIDLFEKAIADAKQALSAAPYMFPLESVISQLQYLIDLEKEMVVDKSALLTVTIGQIAARDIDDFDPRLGELLHEVSAQVRQMTGSR